MIESPLENGSIKIWVYNATILHWFNIKSMANPATEFSRADLQFHTVSRQ